MDKSTLEFSRKYIYPKLSKAEFEQVVELSEHYGLDITKGGYAAFNGKLFMTVYGMLQLALKNGLIGNELGDAPEIEVTAAGKTYTVPQFNTMRVKRSITDKIGGYEDFEATVYFSDYAHTVSHCRYAHMFMEKWALAMALRRGFADVIGNQVSFEEVTAGMVFVNTEVELEVVKTSVGGSVVEKDPYFAHTPTVIKAGDPGAIAEDDPAIQEALKQFTIQSLDKELTKLVTENASDVTTQRQAAEKALAELFG
jgi:hypothetical protein